MTTFPNNPTLNQEFTNNGILFIFNGTGWVPKTLSINPSESGGHIISNETEVFQPKPELQFIGNVEVHNEESKTVVNIPNFDSRYVKRTAENLSILKEYPILYNSYAALDPRGIAPIGFHIPTSTELQTLVNFLGSATAGGKLKTEGLEYWDAPNTGATNSYGFSSKANGIRGGVDGTYSQFRWFHNILSSTPVPGHSDMYYQTQIAFNNSFMGIAGVSGSNKAGMSLRCIKNNNTPSIGDIVDGSGNKYTEVTIGTQIWLSQDLKTTKYINGDTIPNVTSPTTWVTLSTGALCYYNNLMFPANKRVVQTASGDIALIDETSSASGNTEVTVDNAAAYDDTTTYDQEGTVVSFSNPTSLDPQFQTPKLYQLAVALVAAGTDPEESPYDPELLTGNWQYMGETIQAVNDNTSKFIISGADPLGQIKSITGYKHGDNVIFGDYNTVMFFNQNAVAGGSYNPATNTYIEVFKPYDWTDPLKGGWVEQSSTDRQRKFYTDAADIRHNARNYPVGGDIVDLSTGNVLRLTQTGAPFTDDGAATIIPTYKLFDVPCAFVKVGELGGGHTIKDSTTTFTQRAGLKFIGNVAVTDDSGGDNTVVEILGQNITVDLVPTDGSNNPVASNGVFDALAGKLDVSASIASNVSVDASGFNGNLSTTDTNIQLVAQKVDDLVIASGGHVIVDETTTLTQRAKLTFKGTQVTATDNSVNDSTDITFANEIPDVASGEKVVIKTSTAVTADKDVLEMQIAAGTIASANWTTGQATYTGIQGQTTFDSVYKYECIGTNLWIRTMLVEGRLELYLSPDIDDSGGAKTSAQLDTAYPSAQIGQRVWGTTLYVYEKKATNLWRKTSFTTA